MKEDWKECKLSEIMTLIGGGTPKTSNPDYWNGDIPWISVKDFNGERRYVIDTEKKITKLGLENSSTKLLSKGDIIISARGTVGELAIIPSDMAFNQSCYGLRAKEYVDSTFLYYLLKQSVSVLQHNTHGSVFDTITRDTFDGITINLPPLATQQKIATILSSLDDKIELNNKINDNLEQQAQVLFKQLFAEKIENVTDSIGIPLGDIVEIIDNRGKTPPSKSERNQFPILDVGALNSSERIINYKNCTKFVDEQTYNTFFRKGHPQENDILISTVGSLAQMKFFKGTIGCIAQNVVAFRTSKLSPTYLYEYLKFIRNDLLAYDIGSVQPSIKVTHIIKHLIYIPTNDELSKFDSFAKSITEQIYNNVCENERLISLRDTLLPKLMSGEIEVDEVKI